MAERQKRISPAARTAALLNMEAWKYPKTTASLWPPVPYRCGPTRLGMNVKTNTGPDGKNVLAFSNRR
jgi:hypothetical protein